MTPPTEPLRLYRHPLSGHCHRVELFLSLLGVPFEPISLNFAERAHKRPEFLAKNPFGQVPVLEDGDVTLADSNAILVYLARRYDTTARWLPSDPLSAARVQQWLSVAAGQLSAGPAAARRAALFGAKLDVNEARSGALELFAVLDAELSKRRFLVGGEPTIADLALYSYTAHAPEGGVSLEPFVNVRAWLGRVEALPGFVPMKRA